jgi:type 1 glutamine amidotransferase
MTTRSALAAAACAAAFALASTARAGDAPLRVLLLSGQNNHDWKATTPRLKAILEEGGRCAVEVSDAPGTLAPAAFARCDAVVSNWNNWGKTVDDWPEPMKTAFLDVARNGKGVVFVHASCASYPKWEEFHTLAGATWGAGTGHGRVHEFTVTAKDADHPVVKGMAPFKIRDELWHNMAKQPGIRVLATAFSDKAAGGNGQDEPVVMATALGKGRGLNLVLGHDLTAMASPGFAQLLARGTEWAATGAVR